MAHGRIAFPHGSLGASELIAAFTAIPADITFVDAGNIIRYYSDYRIFSRPESCLDTDVLDCHSAGTRPSIASLLAEFRDGRREDVVFAEKKDGRPVSVRYTALRDDEGTYLGCLEIAQWAGEVEG